MRPTYRNTKVRDLLFETIYERRLIGGARLCFATCAPVLARLLRGYGFREFAKPIEDPVVGCLHRMLLVMDDLPHLDSAKSPFLRIAQEHRVKACSRPWLTNLFEAYKAPPK